VIQKGRLIFIAAVQTNNQKWQTGPWLSHFIGEKNYTAMAFNEDSRVKLLAILHLTRLGYQSIPRKNHHLRREETNIFPQLRDWLLPMLMNGHLSICEAYGQAEEALRMAAEENAVYKKA
jgi:hypothetical protein